MPSRSAARPAAFPTVGRLAAAIAVVALVAGCSDNPVPARSGVRPKPGVTGHESTLVPVTTTEPPLPVMPVQWTPCGDLQCGSVTVPLDYDHQGGPTLQIAVARHPAEVPAQRIGSLVINPGGPGASGIDDLPDEVSVLTPEVLDRFDIVSFDPRGVGRSSPVTCTAATGAGHSDDDSGGATPRPGPVHRRGPAGPAPQRPGIRRPVPAVQRDRPPHRRHRRPRHGTSIGSGLPWVMTG